MPRRDSDYASFSLHKDIMDLKSQLSEKESELLRMECSMLPCSGPESTTSNSSTSEAEEWQAKYERLVDAHKKLQRTNICLEEKLLKIVDKFEADKNMITRDLATQTQKVVEAKLTIQQLHKQNTQLKSDLQVALNILQMKPSSFISQKMESLPEDLQSRVRQYATEKQEEKRNFRNGGQKITIAVPNGAFSTNSDEAVSAAILAKVLEERENERKKEQKFCIDIGTQTHGWQFPDAMELLKHARARKLLSMRQDYSLLEELSYLSTEKEISNAKKRFFSQKGYLGETDDESDEDIISKEDMNYHKTHVSNILLASLIQSPPPMNASGHIFENFEEEPSDSWNEKSLREAKENHRKDKSQKSCSRQHSLKETTFDKFENDYSSNIINSNDINEYLSENESIRSLNLLTNHSKTSSICCEATTGRNQATKSNSSSIIQPDSEPNYDTLSTYNDADIYQKPTQTQSSQDTPILSQPSSLSSLLSLTQKATTPTLTSNAFFKRSFSNTSYSALQTDM